MSGASQGERSMVAWWQKHQVALYLSAIVAGGVIGWLLPASAPALEHVIEPSLMLLLFATFLGVPLIEVLRAFRDLRFLGAVLAANFVIVPVVAWGLSRFVAEDQALLIGVLLVLLTPCIDYVIVFTGIAGGDRARLLAATPLLMLAQMLLLPLYFWLFVGGSALSVVEPAPFVRACLLLIVLPLGAAAMVQVVARRHRFGRTVEATMDAAMVPLMMLTLAVVVGSQIAAVGAGLGALWRLVPIYAAFVALAVLLGWVAARVARLDVPGTRAVMFSAATRNSLVVLPLALALPPALALAPLAVVTQTLTELVAMVILVRLVPKIVR